MKKEFWLATIRHVLTAAGGAAASAGYIGADDATTAVGAISALIGLAWSYWDKRNV